MGADEKQTLEIIERKVDEILCFIKGDTDAADGTMERLGLWGRIGLVEHRADNLEQRILRCEEHTVRFQETRRFLWGKVWYVIAALVLWAVTTGLAVLVRE